jgi:hypothetical protein
MVPIFCPSPSEGLEDPTAVASQLPKDREPPGAFRATFSQRPGKPAGLCFVPEILTVLSPGLKRCPTIHPEPPTPGLPCSPYLATGRRRSHRAWGRFWPEPWYRFDGPGRRREKSQYPLGKAALANPGGNGRTRCIVQGQGEAHGWNSTPRTRRYLAGDVCS